jgi:hypothetical protein
VHTSACVVDILLATMFLVVLFSMGSCHDSKLVMQDLCYGWLWSSWNHSVIRLRMQELCAYSRLWDGYHPINLA